MNDKELLELAAKAAAIKFDYWNDGKEPYSSGQGYILPSNAIWNPLADDGDALRLAVRLGMYINIDLGKGCVDTLTNAGSESPREWLEFNGLVQTMEQATRRAIVRAAAEIGKAMP